MSRYHGTVPTLEDMRRVMNRSTYSDSESDKSLVEAGLQEDATIEGKRDRSISSIVDEIEQTLPKTEAEIPETEVKQTL